MTSICILLQGHYEIDIRVRRKAEALVDAGYRVDVLCLRSSYSPSASYALDGVNIYCLALGKMRGSLARYLFEYVAFFLWATFKLARLTRIHRYAIVDVNTLPDFLVFAATPARWRSAKVVLDMHEITPEFYISKYNVAEDGWIIRMLKVVEKASVRYADHVLTINEPIQKLLETRGLAKAKSTIIMNSADDRLFGESDEAKPVSADLSPDPFVLMYHGTLTRIYGLDIALTAFSVALARMPAAEMWILGNGPERASLENLANGLGISSRVKFQGTVLPQEVHQWLRRCDVGVLATRQDVFLDYSFSNKLSEYIVMGKAVISSRLKTIRHYFSEDALAFFEPGNPRDLAEQMVALFVDSERRARQARIARQELEPIRWGVMKERYLQAIARLTATREAGADLARADS